MSRITVQDPWSPKYVQPYYFEMFGKQIGDPEIRARWCKACFYAGNALRLWNQAVELKIAFLAASCLESGHKTLLLGEHLADSGLEAALRSLAKEIITVDISSHTLSKLLASPASLQWDFDTLDKLPDASIDRIILFDAASHIANWPAFAKQVNRVLRDNGRVIVAEAPLGGKEFFEAFRLDGHLEAHSLRILAGLGIKEADLPKTSAASLEEIFKPYLAWSRAHSWQGMYLFYGQKGQKDSIPSLSFQENTKEVAAFLTERTFRIAWDFMTAAEKAAFDDLVGDPEKQFKWGRGTFLAGSLRLMGDLSSNYIELMYENLKAKPGDKVFILGELFEELGFLTELKRRKGEMAELAATDVSVKARSYAKTGAIPQWDYDFADKYPNNYFDIAWIPQGVHHCADWNKFAPKLLRILKPGGQVMMHECRIGGPEWWQGVKMSGFLKCIIEKIYLGPGRNKLSDRQFDVSPEMIAAAFEDSLRDTFSIAGKGWMVYWGYKK